MEYELSPKRMQVFTETPGWLGIEEGQCLYKWASRSYGPLLEIGTYCGKSTIWLGAAAEAIDSQVITIDNLMGCAPLYDRVATHSKMRKAMRDAGLRSRVISIIADSEQVARAIPINYDFCFIDGDHSLAAVTKDFECWGKNALIVAFHDSDEPGPLQVIKKAIADGWEELQVVDSLTVLKAPDPALI